MELARSYQKADNDRQLSPSLRFLEKLIEGVAGVIGVAGRGGPGIAVGGADAADAPFVCLRGPRLRAAQTECTRWPYPSAGSAPE